MSIYPDFKSYRLAWQKAYDEDPPVPLNVDIELASLCNLSCPFCFISDGTFDKMIKQPSEDGKSRRRLMPKELAIKIIEEAAGIGVPALKFNWRGESTIHPDYSEIVKYARSKIIVYKEGGFKFKFLELLVNTNANCKPHAIEGLMNATKVMVSLDSMNQNTYNVMRRGGNIEVAKATISELVRRKHPNLWVRRVLTNDNKHEDFFGQVKAQWGDGVKVSEHFCFDRNESSKHEVAGCDHDNNKDRQYCGYPSQRLVIASSGLVYPCCIDLHEEMPIGNINKQSIEEIWNSKSRMMLAESLRSNVFHSKICQNCQSWMAFKAPQRAFVQDREMRKAGVLK